ncbi:MAG: RDD family protein [Chloroflexi bacterium]|nr:RDD family protein [Chloroflexota bacterium]
MAHMYDDNPIYCSTCGRESDPSARFCDNCGATLESQAVAPQYAPGMPYFDQDARTVEYMGFWIRAAAFLIDAILLTIVRLVIQGALGDSIPVTLFNVVINLAYGVIMIAWRGQTIGKMIVGIQVVDANGNVPGIGSVILREVVGKFLSTIALFLGYLWVAWDKDKRGWHDHISGTYVVRKSRADRTR